MPPIGRFIKGASVDPCTCKDRSINCIIRRDSNRSYIKGVIYLRPVLPSINRFINPLAPHKDSAIGWIGWGVVSLVAPSLNARLLPALLWDIWVAVAFLYLAIRYNSLWIGAAMIAQGFQLGFRALDVILPEARHSIVHLSLVVAINSLNLVMMAMLVGAALAEKRQPSRARRAQASRAGEELPAS